jgi:hypothetical protein
VVAGKLRPFLRNGSVEIDQSNTDEHSEESKLGGSLKVNGSFDEDRALFGSSKKNLVRLGFIDPGIVNLLMRCGQESTLKSNF